jgi:hypothetical protein
MVHWMTNFFWVVIETFLGNDQKLSLTQFGDQNFSIIHYGDQKLVIEVFFFLIIGSMVKIKLPSIG